MLEKSAFGKNDIRGIYGKDITEELYYFTGRGFVQYLTKHSHKIPSEMWITVCRDARLHSKSLSDALINGLRSTGANVVDLGLAPTPIGYYSEVVGINDNVTDGNDIIAAMIITASHNPSQYNGLKMTFDKHSLNESEIQEVCEFTFKEYDTKSTIQYISGQLKEYDLIKDYIQVMAGNFQKVGTGLKIVVDSANATGGIVAPQLYRLMGCKVTEMYSNPDGTFPNHHPNPSDERTLKDIKRMVVQEQADFGIAFDGDSDRIGVIDSKGNSISGDKLLLIYAREIIENYRLTNITPVVVSEVKCSQVLFDTIDELGGKSVMCKTGHGYIKSKMKETGALLAGEMSGHTFFKDKYYGFDDAIYAGCRLIEIVAKYKKENPEFRVEDLLTPFNKVAISPEIRLACPNELKKSVLADFTQYVENNPDMFNTKIKDIITIDGLRIVFDNGFALVRQSNTEPVFTLRFEADSQISCDIYRDVMVSKIEEIVKSKEVQKI